MDTLAELSAWIRQQSFHHAGEGADEAAWADKMQVVATALEEAATALEGLHAEIGDSNRILRSSVPGRWKQTESAVGAVQSYIAELEAENVELRNIKRVWSDNGPAARP